MADSIITSLKNGYKDLDLGFKTHPVYGDIRPVTDINAIKNSVKNILLTKRGERPFNPRFGCDVSKYLFEPADAITMSLIKEEIEYSLGRQEPRIKLNSVEVDDDADRNVYNISLDMTIVNTQTQVDLNLILERLR